MGDLTGLVLLLLPLAAATGWFVARQTRRPEEQDSTGLSPDYVRGLSHLVNNDTDQAIEIFIGLIEADEGTIDLHLALGSLFRKRGEVDRALRIHQNLVERPSLKPRHRNQARYELARDYLAAGVLDRAEDIFLELAHQGMFLSSTLKRLLRIYEREREWARAIDTALWLASAQGRDLGPRVAQYWCELAESAQRRDDQRAREQHLKKALAADPHCVRAQLIAADAAQQRGKPAQALKILRDILRHHEEFIPELMQRWRSAVIDSQGAAAWPAELAQQLKHSDHPYLQTALLREAGDDDELRQLALTAIQNQPSWLGLKAVLDQAVNAPLPAPLGQLLENMAAMLAAPLQQAHRYHCDQCGFSAGQLNWQCPSCHAWNSTRPLSDLPYGALVAASETRSAGAASVVSTGGEGG